MYLTDLLPRFEGEWKAGTASPVDDSAVRAIEAQLADEITELELWLPRDDGLRFYPIRDLDALEEREFLDQIGRITAEADTGFTPFIGTKDLFKAETLRESAMENRKAVLAYLKRRIGGQC